MSQRKPKPKSKAKPKKPGQPALSSYEQARAAAQTAASFSSTPAQAPALLKIDLGCGPNKKPGFIGLDQYAFPGVDHVLNLGDRSAPWPFADNSVEEAYSAHFIEHLDALERVYFMNELFRVLVPGGKASIVVPYWASGRAYGDFTHKFPPISEMYFFYLNAAWRAANAPHNDILWNPLGYSCDFDFGCGYNPHQELIGKSDEVQRFQIQFYKEAAQDIIGTITKRLPGT